MVDNYDVSDPIPREWRTSGAESTFYSIGLSPYKPQNAYITRKWFNRPIIVFAFQLKFLIEYLIIYYINSSKCGHNCDIDYKYQINFDLMFGTDNTLAMLVVCISAVCISCQLLNYNNYNQGIKPVDLQVFQMISGLKSPQSIGINDRQTVRYICKLYAIGRRLVAINIANIIFVCCIAFAAIWPQLSAIYMTGVLVTQFLSHLIWTSYACAMIITQILHYCFLTYYLWHKIHRVNVVIEGYLRRYQNLRQNLSIGKILRDLNTAYEIGRAHV